MSPTTSRRSSPSPVQDKPKQRAASPPERHGSPSTDSDSKSTKQISTTSADQADLSTARKPAHEKWATRPAFKRHTSAMSTTSAHEITEDLILNGGSLSRSKIKVGWNAANTLLFNMKTTISPPTEESAKLARSKGQHLVSRVERRTHKEYAHMGGGGTQLEPAFLRHLMDVVHHHPQTESRSSSIDSKRSEESWTSVQELRYYNQGPRLSVETRRKGHDSDIATVEKRNRAPSQIEKLLFKSILERDTETRKPARIGRDHATHHGRKHAHKGGDRLRLKRRSSSDQWNEDSLSHMYQ